MRFSYCFSLINKRSFCIFSNEYFYENSVDTVITKTFGQSKFFNFFLYMLFEFHNSGISLKLTFVNLGLVKSKCFAELLLQFFQPHFNIRLYFYLNALRYMNPNTVRGESLSRGLPMRGQRTHSKKKSIVRFRDTLIKFLSNYDKQLFINFIDFTNYNSQRAKDIGLIRVKKSKIKSKTPPKNQKKPKKKFNV